MLFDVNIDKTTSFSKGDYLFEWSSDDAMAEQQNQEPRTEEQGKDMVGALRSKEQEAGLSLPSKEDLFRIAKAEKTAVLMTSSLENKILRFLRKSHPESYTADILSAGFVLVRQDLEKMAQAMELSFDGLHKELDLLPGVEKVIVINQLPRRHGGQHDFYATILEEVFHVLEGDVRSDKNWNTSNHRGAAEAVNSFLQILFIPNNKLGKFLEVNKGSMYWSEAETKALMRRYRERSPFNPNMHIREILQQLKEDVENKKRIMIEGKRPLISDVVLKRIGSSEGWLLEYLEILLKYERFSSHQPLFEDWIGTEEGFFEDRAMAADVGGIDLTADGVDIETHGDGVEMNVPIDFENIDPDTITGYVPVIFQIVPITNLNLLLGLEDEKEETTVLSYNM